MRFQQLPEMHRPKAKRWVLLVSMLFLGFTRSFGVTNEEQIAALKAEKDEAVAAVQKIVNQPVTHLQRVPGMNVSIYSPGWFHDGANVPNFDTVDVRTTQELNYQGKFVSSDLNPGEAFNGNELEFNSNTKYFYLDRSVPKKKLTEAEMLKINDLYRVIGRCNREIRKLQYPELQNQDATSADAPDTEAPAPESSLTKAHRYIVAHKPLAGAVIGLLAVLLIAQRLLKPKAG